MQGRTPKPARVQQRCPGGGGITLGLTVEKELAGEHRARRNSVNKGSEARGILVSTERPSNSEFLEICVPFWEERGNGLSSQKGPCHEGIWPEVSAHHSECQRMGDLEGFGAEKEYEVACCIF